MSPYDSTVNPHDRSLPGLKSLLGTRQDARRRAPSQSPCQRLSDGVHRNGFPLLDTSDLRCLKSRLYVIRKEEAEVPLPYFPLGVHLLNFSLQVLYETSYQKFYLSNFPLKVQLLNFPPHIPLLNFTPDVHLFIFPPVVLFY